MKIVAKTRQQRKNLRGTYRHNGKSCICLIYTKDKGLIHASFIRS